MKNIFKVFIKKSNYLKNYIILYKKKGLFETPFKINLKQVFPCFHCVRSIPPTHN